MVLRGKFDLPKQEHYPDLGSDVSPRQYGISAPVSHTSFGGETSSVLISNFLFGEFLNLNPTSCRLPYR